LTRFASKRTKPAPRGLFPFLEPNRIWRYEGQVNPQTPQSLSAEQRAAIDRAEAAIEAFRQALANAGMTPQSAREYLKRAGGEAAVRRADEQAADVLRRIDEEAARERFAQGAPAPRGLIRHGRI